jgi:hypothetical protein
VEDFIVLSIPFMGVRDREELLSHPDYEGARDSYVRNMVEWYKMSPEQRQAWYESGEGRTITMSVSPRITVWSGYLLSFTIKQILDEEDMGLYRRHKYKPELESPWFERAYGSTAQYRCNSSKKSTNGLVYTQKILFKDFVVIAKDKKIPIADAIEYAITSGDVTVKCNCPSFLYHGFKYMATQLGYLYGLPRENRFPKEKNPELRGSACKHITRVLDMINGDASKLEMAFEKLYRKVEEPWLEFYTDEPAADRRDRRTRAATPPPAPVTPEVQEDTVPMDDAVGQPELFAEGDGSDVTDTTGEGMFEQQTTDQETEEEKRERKKREGGFVTDWAMENRQLLDGILGRRL